MNAMKPARRKLLAVGAATAAGAIGAASFWHDVSDPRSGRRKIRFSHVVAEDTPKGKAALYLRDLLFESTGGDVAMEVFPNSTLYKDQEELEALQMGSVEMIAPSLAKLGPLGIRDFELFDLPFLFDDYDALHRVTDGEVGRRLLQTLEPTGLYGVAFWDNGFKQMSANRRLLLPQDFRGLKMRIQSSQVLDAQMRALGAVPDPMALSDVHAALRSGVVDGTENPASNFLTQQMYQVQRHLTLSSHGYLGYVVLVKDRFWRDLPRDMRSTIRECLLKATEFANRIAKGENDLALARIRDLGTTEISSLTEAQRNAWRVALAPVHGQFRQRGKGELLNAVHRAMGTHALA